MLHFRFTFRNENPVTIKEEEKETEEASVPTTANINANPDTTTTRIHDTTTTFQDVRRPKQSNAIDSDYFQDSLDGLDNLDLANAKEEDITTTISVMKTTSNEPVQCCACPGPTTTLSGMLTTTEEVVEDTTTIQDELTTTLLPTTTTDLDEDGDATTTTTTAEDLTTTATEDATETTTLEMSTRGGRDFLDDGEATTTSSPVANHPFAAYFDRLRRIYELDLQILEQLADLLDGVNEEVLPALMSSLEPILPLLMSQQVDNVDLGQIIGYVVQTVQKTRFHFSGSTHVGDLDFIDTGMNILMYEKELHYRKPLFRQDASSYCSLTRVNKNASCKKRQTYPNFHCFIFLKFPLKCTLVFGCIMVASILHDSSIVLLLLLTPF